MGYQLLERLFADPVTFVVTLTTHKTVLLTSFATPESLRVRF